MITLSIIHINSSLAQVGKISPAEWRQFTDEKTGVRTTALTTHPAKDNKIYQTHPNWTADNKYIVFSSDRNGNNQYYAVSVQNGQIIQLTDDKSPAQACLMRQKNTLIYITDKIIWDLNLDAVIDEGISDKSKSRKKIGRLPDKYSISGSASLDANDQTLYLGVKNSESDCAMLALDLKSGISRKIIDIDFRIGHCQAHPTIPGLIMYCWETGGDSEQRMWLVKADGSENGPFYKETYDEWVTHEVWWGENKVLFTIWPKDEVMLAKPHGIASVSLKNRSLQILDSKKYWHVGASEDGQWAVGDSFEGNLWLINGESGKSNLLTQGHRSKGQTVHPHPSFSPDSKKVLFCSEMFGNWNLFLAELPSWQDPN